MISASARREPDLHLQVLAERALGIEPIRQPLIDHRHHAVRAQVVVGDVAALNQSRARHREVARKHRLLAGEHAAFRHAFARKAPVVGHGHRQRRRGGHGFDAGQLARTCVDGAVDQPQPALEIRKRSEAHLDTRGHEARRIESERRVREVPERSQHQAAADERHDRQRDFGDHQRALQAADAGRGGAECGPTATDPCARAA